MSVTIQDMESVARSVGPGPDLRFSDDIGQVIDIGGMGDDLGLSMLANTSKMGGGGSSDGYGNGSSSSSIPSVQFPSSFGGGSGGGLASIELTPLEPLEPISMDMGGSHDFPSLDMKIHREGAGDSYGSFGNSQSATGPGIQLTTAARDPEEEKREKVEYLNKLQRLEQKGFPVSRKFTMDNSLDEVKQEYGRLVDARQLETSLKFQRQMLMGAITGMEWLNGKFDPFDVKLEGWSESVHENVEDFDEIFEELYDKYKDRGKMAPEMRLLLAIGGSGFMCHVSNSFFRQKMPSMDDVLRKNPELARQMAAAAAQSAGPGFGNFMGMAMGVDAGGGGGTGAGAHVPPTGAFFSAPTAMSGRSGGTGSAAAQEEKQTARKEMRGPSGVDDILRTFEEARRAEVVEATGRPSMNERSSHPAVAAAELASEEGSSVADSTRTGATGGGRRRRRNPPPVGNTVSINV